LTGAVLVVWAMLVPRNAAATPTFVRMTGLTCNQCHMSNTPTPDFTFTGVKFRMNGWRAPWTAPKIEAGEEGKLSGKRLVLTQFLPMNLHVRVVMFQQSASAYAPNTVAPPSSSLSTNPQGTVAITIAGPINDYVALWNEIYIYDRAQCAGVANCIPSRQGAINLNHWAIQMATNPGGVGNVLSFSIDANPSGNHQFFAMHSEGTPSDICCGSGTSRYLLMSARTLIADRVGVSVGIEPGEDNWDFAKFNWNLQGGYFILNTDDFWLAPNFTIVTGSDMIPSVSQLSFNADGRSLHYSDAVQGISAARLAAGGSNTPYTSANMGDGTRSLLLLAGGFLDKGPWSMAFSAGWSNESETYSDNSMVKMAAIGFSQRWFYDRTYGFRWGFAKYLHNNYTDPLGKFYDIPHSLSPSFDIIWRWSQNQSFYFSWATSQPSVLGQLYNSGWNWSFNLHFAM